MLLFGKKQAVKDKPHVNSHSRSEAFIPFEVDAVPVGGYSGFEHGAVIKGYRSANSC